LEEVIKYKAARVPENNRVSEERMSPKLVKLNLDDEEVRLLTVFLDQSLRDPDLLRYKPTHILSGNCFPNNDRQSRIDSGCN